jgi:hypothetical protein
MIILYHHISSFIIIIIIFIIYHHHHQQLSVFFWMMFSQTLDDHCDLMCFGDFKPPTMSFPMGPGRCTLNQVADRVRRFDVGAAHRPHVIDHEIARIEGVTSDDKQQ